MKYFQIGLDVESTGLKNSINQVEINKKEIQKNIAYNEFINFFSTKNSDFWYNQDKIKNLKIPPIEAKLLKNARITDVMGYTENISFLNYVYSEKLINILKSFNIGNYVAFEVNINNIEQKYYMLFIETIRLDEINYDKSIVITGYKATNNIKYYRVNNCEEYLEFRQKNVLGGFESIAISKEYYDRDIISIQATGSYFYSEKLIDFLLDCGVTGLAVKYNNSIQLEFV
jgi:hypothetical protein